MARLITGDAPISKPTKGVSLLTMATVKQADLAVATNSINITIESGKQAGSVVGVLLTAGGYSIAVAQGSEPASPWKILDFVAP